MDYDLAIVGSGSVGAAAGYYAALAGLNVALFDRHSPPHHQGGHHGDTRLIRHTDAATPQYAALAQRAQQLWLALEEISALPLFHRCGVLSLGPRHSTFMRGTRASAAQQGVTLNDLSQAALAERWPAIALPATYDALLEPDAGYLKCHLAIASLIEKAAELGAQLHFDCPLHAWHPERDGVRLLAAQGEWRARRVIICAGSGIHSLLPQLPLRILCKPFAWYQAGPNLSEAQHFPALHTLTAQGHYFYSFPAVDGALKAGRYDGGVRVTPPARCPRARDAQEDDEIHDYLQRFLPQVGPCLHGDIASIACTPDDHLILDRLPQAPAITVVAGLGSHGFKLAPALAELALALTRGEAPALNLSPFRLGRWPAVTR